MIPIIKPKVKPKVKPYQKPYGNPFTPYLFLLPNFCIFFMFIVIPAIFGFFYAFTEWDGISKITLVGLDNFKSIFQNRVFWEALERTLVYVIITVPLLFVVSLMLAILLIQKIRFKGIFRAIFYWPTMISFVIVGVTWKWMLGDNFGIINYILTIGGYKPIRWLTDPVYSNLSVIAATIWSRAGFYMVMFISGLQSIPLTYYEACDIDGASTIQKFRYITIPLLKPTSFLVLILSMIDTFKAYALVFSLTEGGPAKATTYLVQTIYEYGFERYQLGYASALSVILFAVLSSLTVIQFKLNKGGEVL
ncbi:MAG: sugar ABC transporter permease [Epulopiscium sp.]|nr:sugar ABC transporter permease [Candidatus Epulonipiscium sp.]